MRQWRIGRVPILWHEAQWRYATRDITDVLVLSWDLHYASLIPSLLRAKAKGVPTILWGHGCSKREAEWRRIPRASVGKLATALLFYNHTVADGFKQHGWPSERIYVALNSLDQSPIQAAREDWLERPDELAQFRREQRLDDGPVVLFVSRLEPDNQVDMLLRAAARLKEGHPGLRVIIVGKGPGGEALRALTTELGLDRQVTFVGALYEEKLLAPWFLCADMFCYPVNMGLSILHAFGYGLPVVTSDRPELHGPEIEALRDGVNGLLYRHGDLDSLVAAIARLANDRDLGRRLGAEARETVLGRFSLRRMVDEYEAAIRYCVSSR